jgi:hypothetical protein
MTYEIAPDARTAPPESADALLWAILAGHSYTMHASDGEVLAVHPDDVKPIGCRTGGAWCD